MMSITINSWGLTDVGQKRSNNQDNFRIDEDLGMYVVADGMGGHKGGEIASELAVDTIHDFMKKNKKLDGVTKVKQSILTSNQVIFDKAHEVNLQGMGTTVTACLVAEGWLYVGQVGDSRCILCREGSLFQITEDHSQVYELLKAGLINENNMHLVQKNVITRSVGFERNVQVDTYAHKMQSGDRYIICSDGLTGMVKDIEMARILLNFKGEKALKHLIDLANLCGGDDNITAILLEVS